MVCAPQYNQVKMQQQHASLTMTAAFQSARQESHEQTDTLSFQKSFCAKRLGTPKGWGGQESRATSRDSSVKHDKGMH